MPKVQEQYSPQQYPPHMGRRVKGLPAYRILCARLDKVD
jgi:hypothetical protein